MANLNIWVWYILQTRENTKGQSIQKINWTNSAIYAKTLHDVDRAGLILKREAWLVVVVFLCFEIPTTKNEAEYEDFITSITFRKKKRKLLFYLMRSII